MVVEACPGSGKTTTLLNRVMRGLKRGYCQAGQVVLISYTKEAANNFKRRLAAQGGPVLRCVTVHGWAYELLARREAICLQEEEEGLALFKSLVDRGEGPEKWAQEDLSVGERWQELNRRREERLLGEYEGLCEVYCREVRDRGKVDFTMLLERCLELGLENKGVRHVMVDEYQDMSRLQLEFLAGVHKGAHFEWYGDPNQAIYGFKGTGDVGPGLIGEVFGCGRLGVEVHSMSWSWRCPDELMKAANRGLGLAEAALRGVVGGGDLAVRVFEGVADEVEAAEQWLRQGLSRRVLVRTRRQVELFDEEVRGRVGTLHSSKGLEWDEVWVFHAVEGCIPHAMGDDREERRLFYVGLTRAKVGVVVSWSERGSKMEPLRCCRWVGLLAGEVQWDDDDEEF